MAEGVGELDLRWKAASRDLQIQLENPESAEVRPAFKKRLVRMAPGSARNWIAVYAVNNPE
jgi:hypothetical protein